MNSFNRYIFASALVPFSPASVQKIPSQLSEVYKKLMRKITGFRKINDKLKAKILEIFYNKLNKLYIQIFMQSDCQINLEQSSKVVII